MPVPEGLSLTEAGGIPETFFTVWTNVFERGGLKPGETLLVHGGLAASAPPPSCWPEHSGAACSPPRAAMKSAGPARALGAERAINYRREDFVDRQGGMTEGRAPMSSSTWSAATISPAISQRRQCRPHRQYRLPQGVQGRGRPAADDAEAPDAFGIDTEAANSGRKGRRSPGARGQGVAAIRQGQIRPANLPDVPPDRGGGSPPAHGIERPYRQDCTRALRCRLSPTLITIARAIIYRPPPHFGIIAE